MLGCRKKSVNGSLHRIKLTLTLNDNKKEKGLLFFYLLLLMVSLILQV